MKIGILGRKVGMTQVFDETRAVVPVTVIQAGPCVVLQKKTPDTDGYHAIQIGLVEKVGRGAVNKPMAGHLKKYGTASVRAVRELRGEFPELAPGSPLTLEQFQGVSAVNVVGTSKGKGFQGVVVRHGFRGGRATHGSMFHRAPGSIGASSDPSRVFKGTKMAGQTGNGRVTVKNLQVVRVDAEKGLLLVRGAVPGPRGGLLLIHGIH
ncbi:MAG: 50S ribosomal protein L3 [Acidobacteriota bacterium]